ncbi:hexose carrier protein [Penicillium macrosclerotiorum]|uniref:hexose carrier protein n=1 Tax=Penicillium macrosclerotiorum TaxID=303699 RepID=UPI00254695E8|nr:hexose carrier protein [Penicillium macrosclerotiorum]KAJ5698703.1 hexose carrier protein [Penicillium macrosclerotiorum]
MRSPTFLGLKGQPLVYAVTLCCSIGFLLFGYDLGFMGGLTTSPEFLGAFGNPGASLLAFLVSSYEVGAMLGAVFQFLQGDRFGRKPNNLAGAVIVAIGATLQASSYGLPQFLVGRIVAGFGLGMMTTVIPIWLSECTSPTSRGKMMAMQLSNLIVGLILANWLDYGMDSHSGSIQWRFPCAFQTVFCLIVLVFMPFLPESPRYLCTKGDISRARIALAALRGGDTDNLDINEELKEIQYAMAVEAEEAGAWNDVFKDNGISGFTRVAIAFSANFCQQLSGCNVMSSLGPYVFEDSIGMSRKDAMLVSGGLQVFYFLSSLIPWYAIDRVGRRRLFMTGSIGMGICMLLSAIFVGIGTKGLGYAAAVVLYIFQTFFTLGWQSNMWIYPSELLPLKLRLRGGALAVVSQWLFTFLVVEITPVMITNIGYKCYIVFAVINFACVPLVYFCYPETSKLPLEAVDLLFADRDGKRPSIWRVVQDSMDKEFVTEIESQLQERARMRADIHDKIESSKAEHLEIQAA